MAFQSNSNNAWIFNGNNGNLNNGNNRINTNYARVFRDSYIRNCERFEDAVVALSELYFFYFTKDQDKKMIILEPSEELVDYIRKYVPRDAYRG